jgi:two-component system sensor histidine kinase YesM
MRISSTFFSFMAAMLLFSNGITAQDTIKKKYSKMDKAALNLQNSLNTNDEMEIAKNYEALAYTFSDKGANQKAEEYLKKALASYTKLKRNSDKTRVKRALAKIQESQNKFFEAIKNYEEAGEIAADKKIEKINSNDANRLKNASNSAMQKEYVTSNIKLLEKESKTEEVADAYVQKAEVNIGEKNSDEAIKSYQQALSFVKDKPKEVIKIKNEIANVYASNNEFQKAIAINTKLLENAKINKDFSTQVKQLQSLAKIYFQQNEDEKAVLALNKAYAIASQKGNSAEAKNSLSQLLQYYKSNNKEAERIALYEQFFNNFDNLIKSDTALINEKRFQITEDKIRQLEKEKGLKDQLISKKNTFNYFLLGSVLVLLLFFALITRALYAIKIKNKEIALQSLRREMNPHFIFNSLNSVNQFISQNKELEANKYLTSYSNLMRNMMENSNKDFVSLATEIEQLQKYLDLEHLRFQDKFDFIISVEDKLDIETTFFPNMIIQPHLENAIWHGLRYLDNKGLLKLSIQLINGKITVTIDDNGIGLNKSQELKTQNQKVHQSRGMTNTKERIALLNELYHKEITFEITEKPFPQTGTKVSISCKLIEKL